MFVQEKMNVLSTFKKKNEYIVDHSFEGDEQFLDGLKDGTEYFINLKENGAIKLLAKHADNVVKNEKMDEKQLDQCMFLFHHLQGKDEFEILYKRDLAKRLLLDTTNRNAEKVMLAKMKKECGAAYTSKLEGMLRDMKQSNELMQEFNVSVHKKKEKKKTDSKCVMLPGATKLTSTTGIQCQYTHTRLLAIIHTYSCSTTPFITESTRFIHKCLYD